MCWTSDERERWLEEELRRSEEPRQPVAVEDDEEERPDVARERESERELVEA
jgi:hypothetical protein